MALGRNKLASCGRYPLDQFGCAFMLAAPKTVPAAAARLELESAAELNL
jgi:hypothetical protein